MQISVSGKNMDTGAAFQTHAEDALNGVVNKYFDRAVSGHVTLEKADAGFRVKTRVALSRRIELEATGYAHNAHAALDAAIEHAEKRLRRHKRKLKISREARGAAAISDAKTSLQSLAAAELHLAARVGRAAQRASATRREHSRRAADATRERRVSSKGRPQRTFDPNTTGE